MLVLGEVVLFVGFLALLGGVLKKLRAGRLADTPFASPSEIAQNGRGIANAKGGIATEGAVRHGPLLTSPVSGMPCLFFELTLRAKWKDGGAEMDKLLLESKEVAPFAIADNNGQVNVTLDPKSSLEYDVTTPMKAKKFSRGLLAALTSKPIEVSPHFSIPVGITYTAASGRQVEVPTTADFFVTERVLEPKPFFHVNGKLLDDGSIGSPAWTSLLVKEKARDVLLADSTTTAKRLLLGGGIGSGLGAVLAAVGFFLAPAKPALAKAPVPTSSVTTTNAITTAAASVSAHALDNAPPAAKAAPAAVKPTAQPAAPPATKGATPAAKPAAPAASTKPAPSASAKAK